jgi:hypothetical protein
LLFVEPDGIHAQSRLFGHLSDLNPAPDHTFSKYTLEYTPESSSLSLEAYKRISVRFRLKEAGARYRRSFCFQRHHRSNVALRGSLALAEGARGRR